MFMLAYASITQRWIDDNKYIRLPNPPQDKTAHQALKLRKKAHLVCVQKD